MRILKGHGNFSDFEIGKITCKTLEAGSLRHLAVGAHGNYLQCFELIHGLLCITNQIVQLFKFS